jgi:hypothetical protein
MVTEEMDCWKNSLKKVKICDWADQEIQTQKQKKDKTKKQICNKLHLIHYINISA